MKYFKSSLRSCLISFSKLDSKLVKTVLNQEIIMRGRAGPVSYYRVLSSLSEGFLICKCKSIMLRGLRNISTLGIKLSRNTGFMTRWELLYTVALLAPWLLPGKICICPDSLGYVPGIGGKKCILRYRCFGQ